MGTYRRRREACPQGPAYLYVRGTRTSLGRWVRTAYRGHPGAQEASELDAKRAIDQGSRLAAVLEEAKPEKVAEYVAPLGFDGWLFQKVNSYRKEKA